MKPAKFVGKTTTVCGWLVGTANIQLNRGDYYPGLSITGDEHSPNLKGWGQRPICLTGEISYIGCGGSDPNILCTDAAHPFAITPRQAR